MKRTNLIYGVGVNDSDYRVTKMVDGKQAVCPFYRRWKNMLMRCFSGSYQEINKSYIGCSVSSEWLSFMSFKRWMEKQEWEGKALDKDIISPNNKVYSKENCCFVDECINNLLCDSLAIRGEYPLGVKLHKPTGRFTARVKIHGNEVSLGYYDTAEEAGKVYASTKMDHMLKIASKQKDHRVANGLAMHAQMLREAY